MITDNLDPNKIYKISFKKGITINPLTWLGGLIRLIAKVEYNHTAILFNIDSDWCLQEAIGEGVITTSLEKSSAYSYYTHYSIEEPNFSYNYENCINRIIGIEGKKYDFKGLLFYQLWLNLFNKWIGKAAHGGDRYYCYESVAYVFAIENSYRVVPKKLNEMFFTIKEGII